MWVSKHIIIEKFNFCFSQLSITKFLMGNMNCFSNIFLSVGIILFYFQHRSQLYMLLQTCFVLHYNISQILLSLWGIREKRKMADSSLLKQIMTRWLAPNELFLKPKRLFAEKVKKMMTCLHIRYDCSFHSLYSNLKEKMRADAPQKMWATNTGSLSSIVQ